MGKNEFLLKEYEMNYNHMLLLSKQRIMLFASTITLIGILLAIGKEAQFPIYLIFNIILSLGITLSITIIGTIVRGSYIVFTRITQIEEELDVIGHGRIWPLYIDESHKDSGAYAFVIACHLLNFIVFLYIFLNSLSKILNKIYFRSESSFFLYKNYINIVVIIFALLAAGYNFWVIKKKVSTKGFYENVKKDYDKAYQAAKDKKRTNEVNKIITYYCLMKNEPEQQ